MSKPIKFELKNPLWTGFMISMGVVTAAGLNQAIEKWHQRAVENPPTVVYFSPELTWPERRRWPGGFI